MRGNERVLQLLRDGQWHTSAEIEEVCQVTCHSRLADLRKVGHVIERRRNKGATGRRMFSWRLTATHVQVDEAREAIASLGETEEGTPARTPSTFLVSPSGVPPVPRMRSIEEVVELLGLHGWVELVDEDQLGLFGVAA